MQSASWALRERVRFDRARITSVSWDSYPILRFTEVPEVAVRIVAAPGEPATGAGETRPGPGRRAPSATRWPTRSASGSATSRSPPSR